MDSTRLPDLVEQLLAAAHEASSRRAAHTLYGDSSRHLRQTVIALTAGASLSDHDSPTEATLLVLHGKVTLTTPDDSWEGSAGDLVTVPAARHGLRAQDDAAVLLTVATR
ncbi:cupin domain-containing protein [Gordonia sp. zg691]|uniref:Cupin domain-containing protein n=1 Tax=Gordonia jinghuaiqii TaxID=2758710 RepID=A0A7D7LV64_9ACTN|nr:cupin domain-containing protein [Gordonia jinghuaiqii]MBD0860914.1 cupin domain-containing protein [Gordonia jinghuaiqii]MCR5979526.1 LuxR family transcriptional regulator [Gordonia jinghuaiqii]QMT00679.1 cupin domain-containing protein [Gordonia jinghuaiqii]